MQRALVIGITIIIASFGLQFFGRMKILDKPGPDIVPKRNPVPTMQGVWLFVAFALCSLFVFPNYQGNHLLRGLLAGGTILLIIAARDEWHYLKGKRDVPTWLRLAVQVAAAAIAVWIGGIQVSELIVQGNVVTVPRTLFVVVFFVWTMLCVNAINWFDGVYGQASGVSSIGFLTIFLLIQLVVLPYYGNISADNLATLTFVQDMAMMLFIVSLVYTIIEYKPHGLVRDLGSMFLGFALAYLSVAGGVKVGTLVVALSLVIFDAIWVGVHRIFWLKKNPLRGDYNHLHHRLLGLGRNRHEVRAFVWGWSLVMMILMLLQGTDRTGKIIIFVLMAGIFFGVNAYLFRYKKLPCGLQKIVKK